MVILVPQHSIDTQTVSPATDTETVSAPQRFQQDMEHLWESVNRLPDGQQRVVLHQLMQFSNTSLHPSPHAFPALATHGFLVEKQVDGQSVWQPSTPHLKEFARLGISSSFRYGYALYPRQTFHINLQATLIQSPHLSQ
jgi:hypothetical protein